MVFNMSETYMERKVQQQAQTINELIIVLDQVSKVFADIESYCNEQGDHGTAIKLCKSKIICHDAISKARGNV